jgi:hypothetical protein
MFEHASTTEILASIIGLYFVAVGVGLVADRGAWQRLATEFSGNLAATYLAGILAYGVGATIVGLHNDWSSRPLAIVVTVIGWLALVKGVLILAFRQSYFAAFGRLTVGAGFAWAAGLGCILLGGAMLYFAFTD